MTDIKELKNTDGLIDINDISVDKDLPKPERIKEYIRQIKNPYCFKCGNFVVKARYQNAGLSIEDCLQSIIIWFFLQSPHSRDRIYYGKRIEKQTNSKTLWFLRTNRKFQGGKFYV